MITKREDVLKQNFNCSLKVSAMLGSSRYMGSGITASGSGSWARDPGSQVMTCDGIRIGQSDGIRIESGI